MTGLTSSYLRALLPKRSRPTNSPFEDFRLALPGVTTDPHRLARYAELCGFPRSGPLPATYPHLTAFPPAMALMTRRAFPFPVLGLIHIANEIEQLRPLSPESVLDYTVWIEPPREHARGVAFDVCAQARVSGDPVWSSVSTYLRRTKPSRSPSTDRRDLHAPEPSPESEHWDLPASLGRHYGAVSGDRNPIHLYPATARAFGYSRPIAHGMWTKARCLAALAERDELPEAFRLRVEFAAPVPLPSPVTCAFETSGPERRFVLRSADGSRRHLAGELSPW